MCSRGEHGLCLLDWIFFGFAEKDVRRGVFSHEYPSPLTHFCLETPKRVISKQYEPSMDATERDVSSKLTLFALNTGIFFLNIAIIKTNQTPSYRTENRPVRRAVTESTGRKRVQHDGFVWEYNIKYSNTSCLFIYLYIYLFCLIHAV